LNSLTLSVPIFSPSFNLYQIFEIKDSIHNIYKVHYTAQQKTGHFLSASFYYGSVLGFFPERQVSEIVPNESSKTTENAIIE
jgi:hypothetical protein